MTMPFTIRLLGLFAALLLQPCTAAEVDSLTPRNLVLPDSRAAINTVFNARIADGVRQANQQSDIRIVDADIGLLSGGDSCDEGMLFRELRKAIFQSRTVAWGLKGYELDTQLRTLLRDYSYPLALNDSIYRDIDYIEGLSLNLKELSDVVTIQGHMVGLDKLGHFFAQGWRYFDMTEFKERPLQQAIDWGRDKEAGLFGYTTTGIFSYADLVANLNGWRFWNKVLLQQPDPLKGPFARLLDRAYVSCDIRVLASIRQGRIVRAWTANSRFDIGDYIDGAWDEANNCNSYADPIIEAKVNARIEAVAPEYVCPLEPRACVRARMRYGGYAKYVLHPFCMAVQ